VKGTVDLCSASTVKLPLDLGHLDFSGVSCPGVAGANSIGMHVLVDSIPFVTGTVNINITASDASNNQLACLDLKVDLEKTEDEILDEYNAL